MAPQSFTGMVISSQNIGETDRRIVLLTREKGKISAFARGAVKPRNPLVSATQHFDFVRKDLNSYYYASYLCELADYYTRENLDAEDILLLLYQSFRAIESDAIDNKLIRYIYEWRMLLINGEAPNVFSCGVCGNKCGSGDYYFSKKRHSVICSDCICEVNDGIKLYPSVLYTLQFILCTPLKKLYTFKVSDMVLAQIKEITDDYIKYNRNYTFNSLWFVENGI